MITLTQEQEQAKQQLLDFLNCNKSGSIILQGMAGTGKTTLIKSVYEAWQRQQALLLLVDNNHKSLDWVFTATTNKACQVLQAIVNAPCMTIHKLLHLRVTTHDLVIASKVVFLKRHVIVIDECSYIDYELLDFIKESAYQCKVIFMGDSTQLPPVGLNHSPVFTQNYPTIRLTEQLRQLHSPEIASYCRALQDYVKMPINFPKLTINDQVIHLSKDEFSKQILNLSDNDKVLSNKNTTVNKYNKLIFKAKHGRDTFHIGDSAVNNTYVSNIATDEIVTIEDIYPSEYYGIKGHKVTIKNSLYFLPTKQSAMKSFYKKILQRDGTTANFIKSKWIDLRPPYACTIHKAQGSTYDNVYIDLNDFKSVRDLSQLAKLLYVAISRARYKIYLTGDIR